MEKIRMKCQKVFHTIHNYIDTDEMILRKSTIAAHAGEKVLIPINMRDGSVWRWEKAIQNSSSSQNRISINSSGMSPNFLHILILFPIVMLKFSPSFDTNTL